MRAAIVSDVHGNLTALEAVVADLRAAAPDVILHGGDLADNGSSPTGVVDLIESLGWAGVAGNTDEMLTTPAAFEAVTASRPALEYIWKPLREMAAFTRNELGTDRLAWLRELPPSQIVGEIALVHASPGSRWQSPSMNATDDELAHAFRELSQRTVIYGHIHTPFVRQSALPLQRYVANSGSAGQSHDGDSRAAYLLIDDGVPSIRRVEYNLERECQALLASGLPHAAWVERIIVSASPQMP
jgi:predicted phosphodiesterase